MRKYGCVQPYATEYDCRSYLPVVVLYCPTHGLTPYMTPTLPVGVCTVSLLPGSAMSLRLTPGARSTLPGMSHGCPVWKTNIGAIDQPPKMYPTRSLRSCPGICHTPDAVKRCFRSEKYGPWFLSNET